MTKKILILLVVVISIITIGAKESKQEKNQKSYTIQSRFFYSDDAGITYGDNKKEFKVGETIYMKVDIEVYEKSKNFWMYLWLGASGGAGTGFVAGSFIPVIGNIVGAVGGTLIGAVGGTVLYFFNSPSLDFVECELIIPNITSVDAKYYDGTVISPLIDELAGITTYPLKIGISDEKSEDITNLEWSFTFQFIPNKESEISVRLIFDDNIPQQYDKMSTIIFVK